MSIWIGHGAHPEAVGCSSRYNNQQLLRVSHCLAEQTLAQSAAKHADVLKDDFGKFFTLLVESRKVTRFEDM